jgi:hypothetical protein
MHMVYQDGVQSSNVVSKNKKVVEFEGMFAEKKNTFLSFWLVDRVYKYRNILESNPHHFHSFRGLKYQMRITIACGLDSRSRAGFWKNDGSHCTIQYNNLLFYLLLIIIYYLSDSPSSLITESLSVLRRDCARLLRKTRFTLPVWLIGARRSVGF